MNRAEIKREARGKVREIRGSSVRISLMIFATNLIISFAANAIGSETGATLMTTLFSLFVTPLMGIASMWFFVRGWHGETPRAGDWMNAIFERPGRKIGGDLWMSLRLVLWALPFIAAIGAYIASVDLAGLFVTDPAQPGVMLNVGLNAGSARYAVSGRLDPAGLIRHWPLTALYLAMTLVLLERSYAYYFTPYILAVCPGVRATEALKLSVRMTKGYRWQLFVAGLSFIGWILLSLLTLGILMLVYVVPYMGLTFAGLFETIRTETIESGRIDLAAFGEDDAPRGKDGSET